MRESGDDIRRYLDGVSRDIQQIIATYLDARDMSMDDFENAVYIDIDRCRSISMPETDWYDALESVASTLLKPLGYTCLLQLTRADVNRSQAEYDIYRERHLAANAAISETENLISQAGEYP
jgi:hypothetical protein